MNADRLDRLKNADIKKGSSETLKDKDKLNEMKAKISGANKNSSKNNAFRIADDGTIIRY